MDTRAKLVALRELADAEDEHDRVCRDLWVRGRRGERITLSDSKRLREAGVRVNEARRRWNASGCRC